MIVSAVSRRRRAVPLSTRPQLVRELARRQVGAFERARQDGVELLAGVRTMPPSRCASEAEEDAAGSATPRWASRPSRCASPRGSTQMRSAVSGGGGAPASSSASTAEATWRAMRIAGAEPSGPSASTVVQAPALGRLGDRDRAALERARVVDAEQVRVVDGPEPVGALEEAHRRQRAGRRARDVQRDRAALALRGAQHGDVGILALDGIDAVAAELAPGLHDANHRISGWLASLRSTNPRLRPPPRSWPRPTWPPAAA